MPVFQGVRTVALLERDADRELRAARLAAGGLTNGEIAQTLFVTAKTVQFHLSNAYRKLGVRSRGELAGVLPPGGA